MSYLGSLRLVFSGTFQADVPTVNNDVRHYDNATFEPRFQKMQDATALNGRWNPDGSGAFRLIDCRVRSVAYLDGSGTEEAGVDPVVGMLIGGSDSRVSAKLVDLDPQWQFASAPWGLDMRLVDGGGAALVSGRFKPQPFRDLLFGRRLAGTTGDNGASAYFQSVLENVSWAGTLPGSRFLSELRQATRQGRLSVRLTTFGYIGNALSERFTLGIVSGVIGPYLDGEPESFVLGRRFTPANGTKSWLGINYFNGRVEAGTGRLFLDVSNALPLSGGTGGLFDVGELSAGSLLDEGISEKDPLHAAGFVPLGPIPYDEPDWLLRTGGIQAFALDAAALTRVQTRALALAARPRGSQDWPRVAIRESAKGLYVCAEPLVHRVDGTADTEAVLYAAAYGLPKAGLTVELQQLGRGVGQGASGTGPLDSKAPIPDTGVPEWAVAFPATLTTGRDGRVTLPIHTRPPGNPRGYIDGQIYFIDYRLQGQPDSALNTFDVIALHVRDSYEVPAQPTWAQHVRPIFVQFGNLYPVMSHKIVDLGDPRDVLRHRDILELALSLDVEDPNSMPVSRDLSGPKRRMLLKWLRQLPEGKDATFTEALREAEAGKKPVTAAAELKATPESAEARQEARASTVDEPGGKSRFARTLNWPGTMDSE